jgi:SAM-dependent methyltransferase
VSASYFTRVLSPWVPGVDNPLTRCLEDLEGPGRLAVDVGCGPGVLVGLLAQSFDKVVAVDQDPNMIEATRELVEVLRSKGARFGEIEFRCQDWASCDDLSGADLVCAVNSILEPSPDKRARMLALLASALAPQGALLAIFPAMEAQLHLLRLYAGRLAAEGLTEEEVRQAIDEELVVGHSFDAVTGTYASLDEPPQKFCYRLELEWDLADAGLAVERTEPVIYPWEACRQVDAGYFPGERELFDWFVSARRVR